MRRPSSSRLRIRTGSVPFQARPRISATWALTSSTALDCSGVRSLAAGTAVVAVDGAVVVVAVALSMVSLALRTVAMPMPATIRTIAIDTRMAIVTLLLPLPAPRL